MLGPLSTIFGLPERSARSENGELESSEGNECQPRGDIVRRDGEDLSCLIDMLGLII